MKNLWTNVIIPALVILVAIVIFVFIAIKLITDEPVAGASSPAQGFDHSVCQYPDRLSNPVDGCDNTDPACPEIAKGALKCPSDVVQPVFSPSVSPVPSQSPKKSVCLE